VLATGLVFSTINRYSPNIQFVYFFYMLYPLFMDAVQMRNYLAFSLVAFSIRYLIEDFKYKRTKYIIFVLLASTIHITSLMYLLLLLTTLKNRKIIYYYIFVVL